MSARYLYAITEYPDLALPVSTGINGAALHTLAYRDIAAIVSPLTETQIPPTSALVWLHERIIETLMTERTVLPARFGTILPTTQILHADMVAHYHHYTAALDHVRGHVELGVHVLWHDSSTAPPEPPPNPPDGRAYMRARLAAARQYQARRAQAEAQAQAITTPLAALARDHVDEVLITPQLLLKAAYLVERSRVTAFQQAVQAQQAANPTLRFLCTGPWPAYHFVSAGD